MVSFWITSWLFPLRAALSFLTLSPLAPRLDLAEPRDRRTVSNSRAFYPATGLLLGLILVGIETGAGQVFPDPFTAALLLAALVVATRALHLDGLMDVCDGIFGGYARERRLEIMKDSHAGAFAVVGGVTVLVLKYGALLSLLGLAAPGKEWALLLFPALSRWAMVVALGVFPYAGGQGLGSPFHREQGKPGGAKIATVTAMLTALAAAFLLGGFGGLGMLAGVTALALLMGWGMSAALGGLTGDTYGAINEIAEVAVLGAAVAILAEGWLEPLPDLLERF